ncbi:MAG: flagellar export chaperone FlgN [Chlamydiia bacterium]|nr:flagellar export chaperone FlgN [Chlamydiia bacterium]
MNAPAKDDKELQERLQKLMTREIGLMRELHSSMQQEQDSLLHSDTKRLQAVMQERETLVEVMLEVRNQRIDTLRALATSIGEMDEKQTELTEEACHAVLERFASEQSCEVLILRDQMLSLLEAMTTQVNRNSYLLQAKVKSTRQLIHRLNPDDPN